MSNVWFSSDWHGGHTNIVKGTSKWEDTTQCRNFDTVEEHDTVLSDNINRIVKSNDHLYFLGDFSMGGRDMIYPFRKRINCNNIHFVGGNHDLHIRKNVILKTDTGYINAQSLFNSYDEILEKKIGDTTFVMCHYPFRTWHKIGRGSIMLHGHCHGNIQDYIFEDNYLKQMDVGIDTHPEFRPYHIDEIRAIMRERVAMNIENRINRT